MLRGAASVTASQQGSALAVRVTNLTAHKLLSGYPEGRRLWINVKWYDAGNVLDGKASTAWRCDGNGVGHVLTFSFPAGTKISKVGLVNGYTKTDPSSGAERYGEYRRITRVTCSWPTTSSKVWGLNFRAIT